MIHKLVKGYPIFQTEALEHYPELNGRQIKLARGLSVPNRYINQLFTNYQGVQITYFAIKMFLGNCTCDEKDRLGLGKSRSLLQSHLEDLQKLPVPQTLFIGALFMGPF